MRALVADPAIQPLRNLFRNPGMVITDRIGIWQGNAPNAITGPAASTVTWSRSGKAQRITWTTRSVAGGDLGPNFNSVAELDAAAGTKVFTVVWDIVVSDSCSIQPLLGNVTNGTATLLDRTAAVTASPGVPVRQWVTFTRSNTDTGIGSIRTSLGNLPLAAGVWAEISNVDAYPGVYQPNRASYYPGTAGWAWSGTVNASESVGYPYTLESQGGAPDTRWVKGDASPVLSTRTWDPYGGRTIYGVVDMFNGGTGAQAFAIYGDLAGSSSGQLLMRRAGTGSSTITNRAEFAGGGSGANGTLTANVTLNGIGRHIVAIWATEGLDQVGVHSNDKADVTTVVPNRGSGLPKGDLARGTLLPLEHDLIAAHVAPSYHNRETRLRVMRWLRDKYVLGQQPINLAPNPSGAVNTTQWFASSSGGNAGVVMSRITGVTTPMPTVTTAIRATINTAGVPNAGGDILFSSGLSFNGSLGATCQVLPGEVHTSSIYVRSSVAQKIRLQNQYVKVGAGAGSNQVTSDVTLVPNTWTKLSLTSTAPSDALALRIDVDAAQAGAIAWAVGDTLDITCLMLNKGPTVYEYSDGDIVGWQWDGTAGVSTSRQKLPVLTT